MNNLQSPLESIGSKVACPVRVQDRPVVIKVAQDDQLALAMIWHFMFNGKMMAKRPRFFEQNGCVDVKLGEYFGEIHYGQKDEGFQFAIPVRVVVVSRLDSFEGIDWLVFSTRQFPSGRFTSTPWRLAMCQVPRISGAINLQARRLALFQDSRVQCREHIIRNAANYLAAEITRLGIFRPEFLSFPGGIESRHFELVSEWVRHECPITLISACCLNADESRTGIVDYLSDKITNLLVRTAKAAFARFPRITEWIISTFGPKDFDWLGDLGIQKVLLPYMWNKPREQVLPDMLKNFQLIKKLGEQLNQALPFPVRVIQLCDNLADVDVSWLVESSHERARQMIPDLMNHPPVIFSQLATPQEIFDRVQQEAFLYLLDTIRYGQKPGETRPAYLNVGLEVHGGYWDYGRLFEGPKGEFLPLSWLDKCVRQHWGPWVLKNKTRLREMARLDSMLTQLGY